MGNVFFNRGNAGKRLTEAFLELDCVPVYD
jgi:hypothetical protein